MGGLVLGVFTSLPATMLPATLRLCAYYYHMPFSYPPHSTIYPQVMCAVLFYSSDDIYNNALMT